MNLINTDSSKFVICVNGLENDDLHVWKLYRVLPDDSAAADTYLRVVDDSGEDYLYPANRFVSVDFPAPVEQKLLAALQTA